MTNYQNLRKLFLYGGIEKDEYQKLRPEIRKENRGLLCVFSQIASAMFLLLLAASIVAKGFASENTTTYLACAVEMLVILFCSHVVLPKHPALVTPLVYVFEILLYAFGIHVSMLHADMPAVSAVAFLLVSPMLFYDRPVRMSVLIAAVVALFCAIVLRCKQPEVAQKDVWNMITFGMVAVAVTVFTMSVKMRALLQSRQIEYLSQTDLLTGAKNRNHYENRLQTYPDMCRSNLACVYADVNGLHEMNNRYGHPAGDKMLREVAEAMQPRLTGCSASWKAKATMSPSESPCARKPRALWTCASLSAWRKQACLPQNRHSIAGRKTTEERDNGEQRRIPDNP